MDKLATYLSAEKERVKGDHAAAERLYRDALEADPSDWKMRECIAECLEASGRKPDALKSLFQAAHQAIAQGSYEDANRLLEKMLRLDPEEELDVTKDVKVALADVTERMADAGAATEPVWEETRDIFSALVDAESTQGYRVPADILDIVDRVPVVKAPARLTLHVAEGIEIALTGRELTVGSGESCHLVLPGLHPVHARFIEMDGRFFVMSGSSEAAVTVDGSSAASGVEVHDGSTLQVGSPGRTLRIAVS